MFRLSFTRIVFTRVVKVPACLFHSSAPVLQNSTSQSNKSTSSATNSSSTVTKNGEFNKTNKSTTLPKIYTRTGDRGTSALLGSGPNRVSKESLIFDVLGTLDELSSVIGIARSTCSFSELLKELETIQCHLFEIGSCVAANNRSSRFIFNNSSLVKHLEEQIDKMTEELPPLRNFILPGGASQTSSYLHFSRAVCRRSERLLTRWLNQQIAEHQEQQDTVMGIYLNRLSDYLFTLARYVTYKEGHEDLPYHKSK